MASTITCWETEVVRRIGLQQANARWRSTFHRYKASPGSSAMRARGLASQRVEVRLGCKILNTMTALVDTPHGEMIG